jgi:hypothetical protein
MVVHVCYQVGITDADGRGSADSLQNVIHNAAPKRISGAKVIAQGMAVFSFSFYARV